MDLFFLKKVIGLLIMPLSIVTLLLIVSLITFKKKPSFSFKCLLSASLLLFLSSTGYIADKLILPLENKYSSFTKLEQPIDYIIILGCGHTSNKDLPATAELKVCSLQRLVEGFRIFNMHPEAQIITSGTSFNDPSSNAEKVKQAFQLLGVPGHKIFVEVFPKDTEEESELIAPRVVGKRVVLVTNADHMIRSVNYFKQQGINVIPAPASYFVKNIESPKNWSYYFPSSQNLKQTTTAWYEAAGLIIQWIKS